MLLLQLALMHVSYLIWCLEDITFHESFFEASVFEEVHNLCVTVSPE